MPLNGIWYSASAVASDVAKGGGGEIFWPSLIMVNGRWEGQVEVRAGKGAATVGM